MRYSAKHIWPCLPNIEVPEKRARNLESGVVLLCWILLQIQKNITFYVFCFDSYVFSNLQFVERARAVDVGWLGEALGGWDGRWDGSWRTVTMMPHPRRTSRRTLGTAPWRTLRRCRRISRRSLLLFVVCSVYPNTIQRRRFHLLRCVVTCV